MPDFRQQILDAVIAKKITRRRLADLAGLNYSGVCEYLRGRDMWSDNVSKLIEIVDGLD